MRGKFSGPTLPQSYDGKGARARILCSLVEKAFAPADVEARWRERWAAAHMGRPSGKGSPYTIALPPPNITAELHMGHAVGSTIQDVLVRYHRMRGRNVEWCPGTDHAAIATNAVIERQLAAEGTSKEAIGRPAFQKRVDEWYSSLTTRIYAQMKVMGFSLDWERARFTMDEPYVRSIREVFVRLYNDGLIYRGPRMVNWCPHCRSAISDEEVAWQEHDDALYHLSYPVEGGGTIEVATVRPETMLGDTAVAVSPNDPRYAPFVGKDVLLPLTGRKIPIVADEAVDPAFGTGALKITPAHDPTDYEVAQRHSLPIIGVIDKDGALIAPDLRHLNGLKGANARLAVLEALTEVGAFVRQEPYHHSVGHCDRCHEILEPLVSEQWWVKMETLAAPAKEAAQSKAVAFHPARYEQVFTTWLDNLRDWCISRQIWLGHAIPVSTCDQGHRFAWVDDPIQCPTCQSTSLTHDPDVLDTWFSSALWPFAIFGWPEQTQDLATFYPTQAVVTAREIIFLWIARMVMMGYRFMDAAPYSDVLITSTVLASDGSRMSKSKGNGVEPIALSNTYGVDAVRAWGSLIGTGTQDVRFDEDRVASFQRFANKLWNVTRFLVMRCGDGECITKVPDVKDEDLLPEDVWMRTHVTLAAQTVTAALESFRTHEAMDSLYDTIWHRLCDWYVEISKRRLADDSPTRDAAVATLVMSLRSLLGLLHPFMPFITDECASRLPGGDVLLDESEWYIPPTPTDDQRTVTASVDTLLDFVAAIRATQQSTSARAGSRFDLAMTAAPQVLSHEVITRILSALLPVEVTWVGAGEASPQGSAVALEGFVGVVATPPLSEEEIGRRRARLEDVEAALARGDAQLANPAFVSRARPDVVEAARRRQTDLLAEKAHLVAEVGGVER